MAGQVSSSRMSGRTSPPTPDIMRSARARPPPPARARAAPPPRLASPRPPPPTPRRAAPRAAVVDPSKRLTMPQRSPPVGQGRGRRVRGRLTETAASAAASAALQSDAPEAVRPSRRRNPLPGRAVEPAARRRALLGAADAHALARRSRGVARRANLAHSRPGRLGRGAFERRICSRYCLLSVTQFNSNFLSHSQLHNPFPRAARPSLARPSLATHKRRPHPDSSAPLLPKDSPPWKAGMPGWPCPDRRARRACPRLRRAGRGRGRRAGKDGDGGGRGVRRQRCGAGPRGRLRRAAHRC